jgi:Protein of unknown function (DUF2917)
MNHTLMRVSQDQVQRTVAPRAAWLVAREGSLWVTRSGDPDDHFLARGERLAVARGDDLLLQAWRSDQPALWDWQARAANAPVIQHRLRGVWALTARALRGTAEVLEALAARARSAAARACRAQGCIRAGESMASSGALQ